MRSKGCSTTQTGPAAGRLSRLETENRELAEKLDEARARLRELRKAGAASTRVVKGSTVHVNIPRLSKANAAATGPDVAALHAAIKELEATVARLTAELAAQAERSQQLEREAAARQAELAAAAAELVASRAAIELAERRAAEAEAAAAARDRELVNERHRVAEAEAARTAATEALDASLAEQARLRRLVGAGGALAAASRETDERQQAEIAAANDTIRSLVSRLEKLGHRFVKPGSTER